MTRPTLIFGDVHGEVSKLQSLLQQARSQFGDLDLYSVGDLLDRGPDPKGVVDLCIREGVQGVLGNHELWLHKYLTTGDFGAESLHPIMGGSATLSSYGGQAGLNVRSIPAVRRGLAVLVPDHHKAYILSLPLYRKIEVAGVPYWLTHAGVSKAMGERFQQHIQEVAEGAGAAIGDPDALLLEIIVKVMPDSILWEHFNPKQPNRFSFSHGVQVFGHTPLPSVLSTPTFIALDTGCGRKRGTPGRSNHLSGVVLLPGGGRQIVRSA